MNWTLEDTKAAWAKAVAFADDHHRLVLGVSCFVLGLVVGMIL